MYIKSLEIDNIRSIKGFKMTFENPAGWHVLIGDNGAGKSTIIRAAALVLIGQALALGLRSDWTDWLSVGEHEGRIALGLSMDEKYDGFPNGNVHLGNEMSDIIRFKRDNGKIQIISDSGLGIYKILENEAIGCFSVAYGPLRRFTGGNPEWSKVFNAQPKLGAHLSAFGEDVALSEAIDWLVKLNYQVLEGKEDESLIENLKSFINSEGFLPNNVKMESISSEGVFFRDGNGNTISVNQLSDGYRSILSLTFELLRQLVRVYGQELVFSNIKHGEMNINLPGVVLIDEIDAHLHPTWQTSIGNWFTKYFPQIQFIVTSHSPLVCRASEKGTIWRLTSHGSDEPSGEITGTDKDKLIFGNVLDAYGTEFFGKSPVRSAKSDEKLEKLGHLNMLAALGKISPEEEQERIQLQQIFTTDDPIGF